MEMAVIYEYKAEIDKGFIYRKLRPFVFPRIHEQKWKQLPPFLSGVLATDNGKAIGLLLGVVFKESKIIRIISLLVDPSYRRGGIATNMVRFLEKEGKGDFEQMVAFYRNHWENASFVKGMLEGLKWSKPKVNIRILQGEIGAIIGIYEGYEEVEVEGFRCLDWTNVSEKEVGEIQQLIANENVPRFLDPLRNFKSLQRKISALLYYQDKIVGWFVVHQISPSTLEYTSVYVSNARTSIKISLIMMKKVIARHFGYLPHSEFIMMIKDSNPGMTRFVHLLERKSNLKIKEVMKTEKTL